MVQHVFWNILRKKIGMFFFSKNFVKIKNPLFREKFIKLFSNFSKTTQYFFLVVFGPLTRVIKTCFEKIFEKKIGNFSNKKISQLFFFLRKNFSRKKFPKDFLHNFFIKGFPLKNWAEWMYSPHANTHRPPNHPHHPPTPTHRSPLN